jgi:hypothetical protein
MIGLLDERKGHLPASMPGKVDPPLLHHLEGKQRGGQSVHGAQAG